MPPLDIAVFQVHLPKGGGGPSPGVAKYMVKRCRHRLIREAQPFRFLLHSL